MFARKEAMSDSGDPYRRTGMDRIRPLEMLVRAVEAGSFARAAAALRVTPSAISHGIAELERRLGATLLYRTSRHLRLTGEGEAAYRRSRDILEQLGALERLATAPAALIGTLRVGIEPTMRSHVLGPPLVAFLRRHPGLTIEFLVQHEPREMHLTGMDLLIRSGRPREGGLVARLLGHVPRVPWASPAYLAEAGTPAEPEDLLRHRCLIFKAAQLPLPLTEWTFERSAELRKVRVPTTILSDHRDSLTALAVAGAGIVRVGLMDPALVTSGALVRVLPEWNCPPMPVVYALYRRVKPLPARIAAFLGFLDQAIATYDPEGLTFIPARRPGRART